MVTKNKTAEIENTEHEKPATGTAVVIKAQAGLPAGLADEMGDGPTMGVSGKADDNIIPFIGVLQDMSPQIKKRDPAYVEGAEAGCLLNKATGQLWKPDPATGVLVNEDGEPLEVQPCAFQRAIVEWVPRDAGGGFVARHEITEPSVEETMMKIGGKQMLDPRDSQGRKKIWRTGDGKNDLIDTRYHFVNIVHSDGRLEPVVLGFASTGHTSSRAWMTLMNNAPRINGRVPHSWFRKYVIKSTTKSNAQGEWFVLTMGDAGWVETADQRAAGRALYESVSSGKVTAAVEEEDLTGGAGTRRSGEDGEDGEDGDLPI